MIEVEGLGKLYKIGAPQERYRTLRDHLVKAARTVAGKAASIFQGGSDPTAEQSFWALRNVSFTVKSGEVLGVIGRNGAGKSTLLKILSRITEPTEGVARIRGRIGSLLEVGTGFHPELTGRENVYLNGAILGMKHAEIDRKFDEIVAFAEVEQFIDTPVKNYSSGMYVRLAFAVAAHLDPDVLLVDEVLAVGDAGFQKKCIASIRDSTRKGRTALVVSHNLGLLRSLCTSAMLLDRGGLVAEGEPDRVITTYHNSCGSSEPVYNTRASNDGKPVHVIQALLRDEDGNVVSEIPCGAGIRVELTVACSEGEKVLRPWIGVRFISAAGDLVSHVANREAGYELPPLEGVVMYTCAIPSSNILPGEYLLGFVVADANHNTYDRNDNALSFTITPADNFKSGMVASSAYGLVFLHSRWTACPRREFEKLHLPAQ
jgi:lipopolysaccharide transport system ATP-binding protein